MRVNVHVGAVVGDQGLLQSTAYESLRYRRLLGLDIKILADVQAKHAAPLAPVPIELEARDAVSRGLADALSSPGAATGEPTAMADLKRCGAPRPSPAARRQRRRPRSPPPISCPSPTASSWART